MCDCINKVDDELRKRNLRLSSFVLVMPDLHPVVTMGTQWVDAKKAPRGSRNYPPSINARFCPMCGEKMPESIK